MKTKTSFSRQSRLFFERFHSLVNSSLPKSNSSELFATGGAGCFFNSNLPGGLSKSGQFFFFQALYSCQHRSINYFQRTFKNLNFKRVNEPNYFRNQAFCLLFEC